MVPLLAGQDRPVEVGVAAAEDVEVVIVVVAPGGSSSLAPHTWL